MAENLTCELFRMQEKQRKWFGQNFLTRPSQWIKEQLTTGTYYWKKRKDAVEMENVSYGPQTITNDVNLASASLLGPCSIIFRFIRFRVTRCHPGWWLQCGMRFLVYCIALEVVMLILPLLVADKWECWNLANTV